MKLKIILGIFLLLFLSTTMVSAEEPAYRGTEEGDRLLSTGIRCSHIRSGDPCWGLSDRWMGTSIQPTLNRVAQVHYTFNETPASKEMHVKDSSGEYKYTMPTACMARDQFQITVKIDYRTRKVTYYCWGSKMIPVNSHLNTEKVYDVWFDWTPEPVMEVNTNLPQTVQPNGTFKLNINLNMANVGFYFLVQPIPEGFVWWDINPSSYQNPPEPNTGDIKLFNMNYATEQDYRYWIQAPGEEGVFNFTLRYGFNNATVLYHEGEVTVAECVDPYPGDLDCNKEISENELLLGIEQWQNEEITLLEMLMIATLWLIG